MSAPNAGRQSPDPETQSGKQQSDTPAGGSGQTDSSSKKDENKGTEAQTANLESNPKHILEDAAHAKTSKTQDPTK